MQSELKPCPFCGNGDAPFVIVEDLVWVECGDCTSKVVVGSFNTEDEAIAAWNARASDAEITRLTEALRAAEERERVLLSALEEWMFRYFWRVDGMPVEAARIHAQSRMKIAALAGAKP